MLLAVTAKAAIEPVIPKGNHGSNWRSEGLCGRATPGWVIQIEISDESIAIPKIIDAVLDPKSLPLSSGCMFMGGWRDGVVEGTDLEFRLTRWVPEARLEGIIKAIALQGEVKYLESVRSQGTFDEKMVEEHARAEKRWKDDPKLDWDPIEKRIVRDQLHFLAPKVLSYQETRDKVPLHVYIVKKNGLKTLSLGESPTDLQDFSSAPTWVGVESRMASKNVAERRSAAVRLKKLAGTVKPGSDDTGGVGMDIKMVGSEMVIVSIAPESPLITAVSPGDVIEKIDFNQATHPLQIVYGIQGDSKQRVHFLFRKRDGTRLEAGVDRLVLYPGAKRFEDQLWRAMEDGDPLISELVIPLLQNATLDKPRREKTLRRLIADKAPRVRLAAIRALEESLKQ